MEALGFVALRRFLLIFITRRKGCFADQMLVIHDGDTRVLATPRLGITGPGMLKSDNALTCGCRAVLREIFAVGGGKPRHSAAEPYYSKSFK